MGRNGGYGLFCRLLSAFGSGLGFACVWFHTYKKIGVWYFFTKKRTKVA